MTNAQAGGARGLASALRRAYPAAMAEATVRGAQVSGKALDSRVSRKNDYPASVLLSKVAAGATGDRKKKLEKAASHAKAMKY